MPEVNVPINWANVDWVYVILLTVFVFLAALIGNLLSFNHRGWGALLSALLFAVAFVFWSYYPDGAGARAGRHADHAGGGYAKAGQSGPGRHAAEKPGHHS
ncbi:MAG: hypothetical protein P8Y53_16725 [Pseudolabrys sp.]